MKKKLIVLASVILTLSACSVCDKRKDSAKESASSHQPAQRLQLISLEELATLEQQHSARIAQAKEQTKDSSSPKPTQPGQLILKDAKETTQYASRDTVDDSKGPEIKILQPLLSDTVSNPMSVHVEFASRSETGVNMNSLKLTYKKYWGIDLTDRIVDYIEGNSINAPDVELPEGKHTLEIYIEDENKNVSRKLIKVEVADS